MDLFPARTWLLSVLVVACAAALCPASKADEPCSCEVCACDHDEPKTLLDWTFGCKCEKEEEEEEDGIEPLTADRPDFTEASSTVGKGRIQIETGYTYTEDEEGGVRVRSHSFPETLLRVGLFAEWLEFRFGWNYLLERTSMGGTSESAEGPEDIYIGVKLALTEQKCLMPETALIIQSTVPTGDEAFTADEFLPGINYVYSWEVWDCMAIGGSTQGNRAIDGLGHPYLEFAQSAAIGVGLTERLAGFTEWYAFFPFSQIDPDVGVEHYVNGGLTYLISPDFQVDARVGFGLSDRSDDLFIGFGSAFRY